MGIETIIIVVTYNSQDFIENCLGSILDSGYKNWFLAVADNNSRDNTLEKIYSFMGKRGTGPAGNDFKNFKLIEFKKNLGFAPAVNSVFFKCFLAGENLSHFPSLKYLLLVNPDLILEKDTISNLLKSLEIKKAGAAGGLIYDYQGQNIQHAGGRVNDNFITYHLTGKPGRENGIFESDYVTGALLATRVEYFSKLGGFDTGYRPLYFEELDYCKKLEKLHLVSVVNPEARARHFEGASINKFSPDFYRYYHKNRLRCAIINLGLKDMLARFIPGELRWLKKGVTSDQYLPLLQAYFLNFLFLSYNLVIKIRNFFLIRHFAENKISNL